MGEHYQRLNKKLDLHLQKQPKQSTPPLHNDKHQLYARVKKVTVSSFLTATAPLNSLSHHSARALTISASVISLIRRHYFAGILQGFLHLHF